MASAVAAAMVTTNKQEHFRTGLHPLLQTLTQWLSNLHYPRWRFLVGCHSRLGRRACRYLLLETVCSEA
jgi:hypothetical protein